MSQVLPLKTKEDYIPDTDAAQFFKNRMHLLDLEIPELCDSFEAFLEGRQPTLAEARRFYGNLRESQQVCQPKPLSLPTDEPDLSVDELNQRFSELASDMNVPQHLLHDLFEKFCNGSPKGETAVAEFYLAVADDPGAVIGKSLKSREEIYEIISTKERELQQQVFNGARIDSVRNALKIFSALVHMRWVEASRRKYNAGPKEQKYEHTWVNAFHSEILIELRKNKYDQEEDMSKNTVTNSINMLVKAGMVRVCLKGFKTNSGYSVRSWFSLSSERTECFLGLLGLYSEYPENPKDWPEMDVPPAMTYPEEKIQDFVQKMEDFLQRARQRKLQIDQPSNQQVSSGHLTLVETTVESTTYPKLGLYLLSNTIYYILYIRGRYILALSYPMVEEGGCENRKNFKQPAQLQHRQRSGYFGCGPPSDSG